MEEQLTPICIESKSSHNSQNRQSDHEVIYRVARFHARKRGLCPEDMEDCAISLVERLVLSGILHTAFPSGPPGAWLHRCASNHASNFSRNVRRRAMMEAPLDSATLETIWSSPKQNALHFEDEWASIDRHEQIVSASALLDPVPRAILLKHYIYGRSIRTLAEEYDRTTGAIEHVLWRARRRIRSVLSRRGILCPSNNEPNSGLTAKDEHRVERTNRSVSR
jgi:RNA polymerase sigma factor (sigma-70 family)